MTEQMIKEAIASEQKCPKNEISIEKIKVLPGSNVGDNFVCQIFSLTVNVSISSLGKKELKYMVKTLPKDDLAAQAIKEVIKLFFWLFQLIKTVFF